MRPIRPLLTVAAVLALAACKPSEPQQEPAAPAEEPDLRAPFAPLPATVEADAAKVDLGNRLYHDPMLSGDGTVSCATCHDIANGGDDGLPTSTGIDSQRGPINSPTVLNASFNFVQFWDGRAADLKEQAAGPVENPLEMGGAFADVVARLQTSPGYVEAFAAIYDDGITRDNITDAIAEFETTLVTRSRFDTWLEGDDSALTPEELHGLERFVGVGCTTCHNGAVLGGTTYQKMGLVEDYFAMRGGQITEADLGRFNVTGDEADRHKFKVPLLRNITETAPYFHDGTVEDLSEAVRIMAQVQLGQQLPDEDVTAITTFLGALTGDIPQDIALEPYPYETPPAEGSGAEAPAEEVAPL